MSMNKARTFPKAFLKVFSLESSRAAIDGLESIFDFRFRLSRERERVTRFCEWTKREDFVNFVAKELNLQNSFTANPWAFPMTILGLYCDLKWHYYPLMYRWQLFIGWSNSRYDLFTPTKLVHAASCDTCRGIKVLVWATVELHGINI